MEDEILNDIVPLEDLRTFERIYNQESEEHKLPLRETQFNYAWCLVRSRFSVDIRKGIILLERLLESEDSSHENANRDYLYYLALGNARIQEYSIALRYANDFLAIEPNNHQVDSMKTLIKKKMDAKMLCELTKASGYAAFVGGVVAVLFVLAKVMK